MKTNCHIWILEDDSDAIFVYREILELRYHLHFFTNLTEFRAALQDLKPNETLLFDLLIADLRLPDGNFLEFLGDEKTSELIDVPFLVISSCDDLDILRVCFDEGALDYLTKPFTKSELIVKIERFLRPKRISATEPAKTSIVFDPVTLTVSKGDDVISHLTAKELGIFSVLYKNMGQKVSRRLLYSEVWKDISVSTKTLDVHLFNLRKKLSTLGLRIRFIPPDGFVLLSDGMHSEPQVGSPVRLIKSDLGIPYSKT